MVESKKRVNQSLEKTKKPLKQIKLNKNTKITKNAKKEQPIIKEQPVIEQEEEEQEKEIKEKKEEEKSILEDKMTFNNEEEEEEEEKEEEEEDKDDFEINKNEVKEEVEVEVEKKIKAKTNEQLLCERFIKTMAASYAQQLKGKNSTGSTLRGLYFESINQLKHEGIRELLFKPQSWHKFYRIVRAILKSKKDNDIEDIEIKETVDDEDEEEDDEDEEKESENKLEDEEEISNTIFKNLLSYEVISGRESLIQQLKDNQSEELQHLYKQSISLNQSDKYSIIVNSFFITSKLSPSQLLHKFIMYSLTLNNVTNEIIDMLNTIIDLSDISDKESNSSIYKSLRQFLSISILDNLKNNSSSNNNNSNDNDISMIKSYVKLATNLFKFSLLNSSNSSIQFIESDYSAIKLLLGKSITFLPKLVSMMTSFDFSQDQFIQQPPQQQQQSSSNKNNINNISIFLNQFIQESKLSNPPTNSISYLKSRILCERGILVLTKLKDPLLTKLKISSATLPVPESLLNFFKEKQGQSLLVKTHKSMDDTQAIRLLKLNNLLEILNKIEEIENQQQQQKQTDDKENDYIEDHYIINKEGNTNENGDENVDENGDEQIEDQIDSMEGTKSLLDFLDEDDLKSDDE
ncbi:hypothetical protein ACTA71_007587 [Dictyostelium dimigraforme]